MVFQFDLSLTFDLLFKHSVVHFISGNSEKNKIKNDTFHLGQCDLHLNHRTCNATKRELKVALDMLKF